MELRAPPTASATPSSSAKPALYLQILTLVALVGGLGWLGSGAGTTHTDNDADQIREVASKLKAAGADAEAAELYADYLERGEGDAAGRASIAYSLGQLHLESGQYQKALRWFYTSEALGPGELAEQVNQKIVHSLERLGRVHAAQAALNSRAGLETADATKRPTDDPIVARIGTDDITRSQVERSLDDLPPQVQQMFQNPTQKQEYLRKFIADELLWRKAQKLEVEKDPDVQRQMQALMKQLVVSKFIERELTSNVQVDDADLRTYHEANRFQYDQREGAKLSVIKVADQKTAATLRGKATTAAGFSQVAKTHSLHASSKAKGGQVDAWVYRGDDFLAVRDSPAAILLSDGLFATAKGSVSQPVVAGGYAYLFFVHDRKAGKEKPFDEVRGAVERDYRRMKMQSSYQELIAQQLSAGDVEIFAEAMIQ